MEVKQAIPYKEYLTQHGKPEAKNTMLLSITDAEGELHLISPVVDVAVEHHVYNETKPPYNATIEVDGAEDKTATQQVAGDQKELTHVKIPLTFPRTLKPPVYLALALTNDPTPEQAEQWVSLGYTRIIWNPKMCYVVQTDEGITLTTYRKQYMIKKNRPER